MLVARAAHTGAHKSQAGQRKWSLPFSCGSFVSFSFRPYSGFLGASKKNYDNNRQQVVHDGNEEQVSVI
jgi:hypothetical protein